MNTIEKLPSVATVIAALKGGRVTLPPLVFDLDESDACGIGKRGVDAFVVGRWGDSSITFASIIRASSTPKAFMTGVAILKTAIPPESRPLLFLAPYFSEAQLQELEREGICGVDLCGNGVITVPPGLTVFRTGQPNRFPSYSPIKNIYRKNCSVVGRAFLASPRFSSVKEVVEAIARRDTLASVMGGKSLTFSTVSKVLSGMAEDVLIERASGSIALLQPEALLEKLADSYVAPSNAAVALKVTVTGSELIARLVSAAARIRAPVVATGLSSVGRYAVMQREDKLSVYCPRAEALMEQLAPITTTSTRFPNLEILESQDAPVYFNALSDGGFYWASPVQAYLELMAGDKRDQDTATQVRAFVLNALKGGRTSGCADDGR